MHCRQPSTKEIGLVFIIVWPHWVAAVRLVQVVPEEVAGLLGIGVPPIVAIKPGVLIEVVALQSLRTRHCLGSTRPQSELELMSTSNAQQAFV